ncbi:MAG: signal peptidase II [Verrucomicrobiae bacterium]|nr:signal peptidase II [Verrucomicrobiae bacterium]
MTRQDEGGGGALRRTGPGAVFCWTLGAWLALDQATKWAASAWLKDAPPVVIVPDFLQLIYSTNTGAAFGVLRNSPALPVLTVLILFWMIWLGRSLHWRDWKAQVGAGMVLAGAAGNLCDRARLGHVVDFIDFFVAAWDWHYPTFNVADTGICVGLALVLWSESRRGDKKHDPAAGRGAGDQAPEKCGDPGAQLPGA